MQMPRKQCQWGHQHSEWPTRLPERALFHAPLCTSRGIAPPTRSLFRFGGREVVQRFWYLFAMAGAMWMTRNDVFRPGVKRSARLGARAPPAVLFAALIAGRSLAPSYFSPSACLVVWSLFVMPCRYGQHRVSQAGPRKGGNRFCTCTRTARHDDMTSREALGISRAVERRCPDDARCCG